MNTAYKTELNPKFEIADRRTDQRDY